MDEVPQIKKLDEAVINRIAAGEVIQRPANALKEMIENSLDAKSTNIQITVRNGGLKLLQIQDNGTGIRKEDLEIVCERFTTSKLREFEDLHTISTYGFRGEALASISHIAHLTIISKTSKDICAYQVNYVDSKMQGAPKPLAGNQGTIITVLDLFYNMNVRRKSLRSPAEEYQKISDVVSKYAIHNSSVGFVLKKSGENVDIRTPPNSNYTDNIRIIYGNAIARELIEFSTENDAFKFKVHGYVTNVNYSSKKMTFLLFINHRLVDCQSLKRCIDQVYATYLPKNSHPFVYLSLELDPSNVDVNVHPTKHEVHFLNEEQIVESIMTALETKLLGSNNSRVFYTQAKLPGVQIETITVKDKDKTLNQTINPKDYVRTDSNEQKLEKFFGAPVKKSDMPQSESKNAKQLDVSINEEVFEKQHEKFLERNEKFEENIMNKTVENGKKSPEKVVKSPEKSTEKGSLNESFITKITRVDTKLTSILEMRKIVEENCHRMLRETFAQHVFVGCINPTQSLIQYSTKLFLCNTTEILKELFYQFVIYNFQNFAKIDLVNPLSIKELALVCLDLPEAGWTPEDGDKEDLAKKITELLTEKGEMLNDYFSIEIDENGYLRTLPLLLDNYSPDVSGLPMFIVRLATEVNWENERQCFESFSKETAIFYSQVSEQVREDGKDWQWITEYVLYPAIKEYFIPSKVFTENAAILEIANLPNLYKVFERC